MSCWVVPSLAADLWQMPLEEVLRLVREGAVPTKQEEGFTFIDVAPESPKIGQPKLAPQHRPPTFMPAADEADVNVVVVDDGNGDLMADETQSNDFGDWKKSRARVSLTRIGPPRRLSA